ncbi:MAG: 4-hydroxy-tetrahydrodipicolinate synthase [Pelagibacteraceae bacterium]|jgi:4-hydroxy-tetrahydrodipicolinate synthase|nr:4-hydroxy-tetrahydrodipicolinate synthase [Pelagibacteraceae bacterium]HJO14104.1 4-hydroxy-tetrahydrodipicolinate synthase [Alphaproteobacteria bacterium]MBO6466313.1 4-hydroxy-tetrahydrodipicolinate synthase [Pelagibacteraceae bacterium]MBO6468093.1 4-hydroxy-tetrahydrodipicolinate synthase [Pelagibacteraceae bacterium]MBO6469535.1 4-hydroxy-tetrahydrodipicolinate synthase [Pelagibacteraceae bacterium]|tara:strand:+ start:58 stop:930 length:873 start_codon:yes stop_codon:yes gene_type:complete
MFFGSIPALITPFYKGEIDYDSFQKIIEWSIEQGSHSFVPCGTTGESPTLSHDEHKNVVDECIKIVDKRVPVIAGTGSNNTIEAIEFTKHAEESGADGALIVTPYYNKPTQAGLYLHYKKIAESTSLPIIIYNIPGRSIVDMSIETMVELSKIKNIIGVKDATNDLFRPLLTRTKIKKDFCYLSGEDGTALAYLVQGGNGCISVTANIAPKLCSELHNYWKNKEIDKALQINLKLAKIHHALFIESSPGPVKYAAELLNLCSAETRLPIAPIKDSTKLIIKKCMNEANLI